MRLLTFARSLALFVFLFSSIAINAQTSAFTYQGRLTYKGETANGNYYMQFSLFNMENGGAQIGTAQTALVTVTNGAFTVKLDFGAAVFNTTNARFLEIAVKRMAEAQYTTLSPRQEITSAPFALRASQATQADSLSSACVGCVTDGQIASVSGSKITGNVANAATANNALNLGGTAANQYVLTTDARLSNSRTPTGAAGGALTGNYPNPSIANNAVRGAHIADGSLGMNDIFVFNTSGPATGNPFTLQGNSCANFILSLSGIFDVQEDDVLIISMKDRPNGLVITPTTQNSNDAANDFLGYQMCNATNSALTLTNSTINRYMVIRPGGNSSAANEDSAARRTIQLPPPITIQPTSNEKLIPETKNRKTKRSN